MLPGENAAWTTVIAAYVAAGELVEEFLAGVVEGFELQDFAAEIAEFGEPVAGIEREEGVNLLAQALGERGAVTGGGDGDLKVAATDHGREVEVAEGWVVDGVDQDAGGFGFGEDGTVDGGDVGGCDDEELVGEVSGDVLAEVELDFAGGCEFGDALVGLGRDDGDARGGSEEGFDLRLSEMARADDGAGAVGEFEEDGEEGHGYQAIFSRSVASRA